MKFKKHIRKFILALFVFLSIFKSIVGFGQSNSDEYLNQLIDNGSTKDIEIKTDKLEKQIDKVCDSAILFLQSYKKDTTLVYGLLKVFQSQKKTYQELLRGESELVDLSYGNPFIAKQIRQAATAGYYYLALKERYKFLKTMYDNTKENLDPFGQ